MKFIVYGPDDIPIQEEPFDTRDQAVAGIAQFVQRFKPQGYYAGVGYRLPIAEIAGRCRIEETEEDEE